MDDVRLPPRAAWPRFPWKDSGWWFGVAAMVATLAFFLAPGMMQLETGRKLIVSVVLLVSPLPLLLLRHASAVASIVGQRVYFYPRLYRIFEQRSGTSDTLSRHLVDTIEQWPRYELLRIYWFRERDELCLLIRKKGGRQPAIGAIFFLYDTDSRRLLAVSEMIEIRGDGYYARVTKHLEALWLGAVRASELPEWPPPPGVSVILRPKREDS